MKKRIQPYDREKKQAANRQRAAARNRQWAREQALDRIDRAWSKRQEREGGGRTLVDLDSEQ